MILKRERARARAFAIRSRSSSRIIYLNDYLFAKYANCGVSGCCYRALFALASNLLSFEQINGNANKNISVFVYHGNTMNGRFILFKASLDRNLKINLKISLILSKVFLNNLSKIMTILDQNNRKIWVWFSDYRDVDGAKSVCCSRLYDAVFAHVFSG